MHQEVGQNINTLEWHNEEILKKKKNMNCLSTFCKKKKHIHL